jgi:hypothetical protein
MRPRRARRTSSVAAARVPRALVRLEHRARPAAQHSSLRRVAQAAVVAVAAVAAAACRSPILVISRRIPAAVARAAAVDAAAVAAVQPQVRWSCRVRITLRSWSAAR